MRLVPEEIESVLLGSLSFRRGRAEWRFVLHSNPDGSGQYLLGQLTLSIHLSVQSIHCSTLGISEVKATGDRVAGRITLVEHVGRDEDHRDYSA
jgi:hypothetical protein